MHVREIDLPPYARSLSTLRRIDYSDAFVLELPRDDDRTPLAWARAFVEGAPARFRATAPRAWFARLLWTAIQGTLAAP